MSLVVDRPRSSASLRSSTSAESLLSIEESRFLPGVRATVHVDRPLYYDYEVVTGRATLALNSKKPPGRSRAHTHATSQSPRGNVLNDEFASPNPIQRTRSVQSVQSTRDSLANMDLNAGDQPGEGGDAVSAGRLPSAGPGNVKTFYTLSLVLWCRWVHDNVNRPSIAYKLFNQNQVLAEVLELSREPGKDFYTWEFSLPLPDADQCPPSFSCSMGKLVWHVALVYAKEAGGGLGHGVGMLATAPFRKAQLYHQVPGLLPVAQAEVSVTDTKFGLLPSGKTAKVRGEAKLDKIVFSPREPIQLHLTFHDSGTSRSTLLRKLCVKVIQTVTVNITTATDKVRTNNKYTLDHTKSVFSKDAGVVNAWGLAQLEDEEGNPKGWLAERSVTLRPSVTRTLIMDKVVRCGHQRITEDLERWLESGDDGMDTGEGNEGSSNIDNEDADGEEICCQSDPEAESDEETNPDLTDNEVPDIPTVLGYVGRLERKCLLAPTCDFEQEQRVVKLEYAIHIKMTLKTGDHLRMTLPLVIKSPDEEAQKVLRRTMSDFELFDLQVFPRTDSGLPEYNDVSRISVPTHSSLRKEGDNSIFYLTRKVSENVDAPGSPSSVVRRKSSASNRVLATVRRRLSTLGKGKRSSQYNESSHSVL